METTKTSYTVRITRIANNRYAPTVRKFFYWRDVKNFACRYEKSIHFEVSITKSTWDLSREYTSNYKVSYYEDQSP